MLPHPTTLNALATIRRGELVAEADHCWLAKRATNEETAHRGWSVLAALAMALALPLAAILLG